MKIKLSILLLMTGALVIGSVGCKKEEPTVTSAVEATKEAAGQAVEAVKDAAAATSEGAQKMAADAKDGAAAAVEQVKEAAAAVTAPAAPVADKADGIIEQAKSLVGEGKFQEALTALGNLSGMTLSEAQQKIVDGLKEQIQKALAGNAAAEGASAVGGLLGK